MKRISLITLGALIVFVLLDVLVFAREGDYFWYNIPGYFAVFGFVGCIVIVLASKWIGHAWLQRDEDYYDDGDRNVQ